ncbi:OX-2 membrane glycoprotein-like [Centroberyx affinis]|uniref:OX-2 membrane glycoprotein-like n=1 Tax=Centroberyx affinis TaxID=166261 RepID=UPI003A5C2957
MMVQVLLLVYGLFTAVSSEVTVDGDATADFGGDAHYRCAVTDITGVLQVTWQRHYKDEAIENLASYNKRFGKQINEPHRGKVILTEASLNSTSITVKNVTWGDEACYICSFNVFPGGSKRKQICLTVQGISEVTPHVQRIPSSGPDVEVVVSCSATGKPAPAVQWHIPPGIVSKEPSHRTVTNDDHTFTTNSSVALRLPPHWEGYVDCLLNTGTRGQRKEPIHILDLSGRHDNETEDKGGGLSNSGIAVVVVLIILISCIVIFALARRKRLQGRSIAMYHRGDGNV